MKPKTHKTRPNWKKILLGVVGAILVLTVLTVGGVSLWMQSWKIYSLDTGASIRYPSSWYQTNIDVNGKAYGRFDTISNVINLTSNKKRIQIDIYRINPRAGYSVEQEAKLSSEEFTTLSNTLLKINEISGRKIYSTNKLQQKDYFIPIGDRVYQIEITFISGRNVISNWIYNFLAQQVINSLKIAINSENLSVIPNPTPEIIQQSNSGSNAFKKVKMKGCGSDFPNLTYQINLPGNWKVSRENSQFETYYVAKGIGQTVGVGCTLEPGGDICGDHGSQWTNFKVGSKTQEACFGNLNGVWIMGVLNIPGLGSSDKETLFFTTSGLDKANIDKLLSTFEVISK